jgi:hypothetical protein
MALNMENVNEVELKKPKMDILSLNNTIVKLRPIVKQSKVHSIHKLSSAIKARETTLDVCCSKPFWELLIVSPVQFLFLVCDA